MLGIGFWEALLIAVLLLIAVGPERLPSAIRSMVRVYRQMKRAAEEIRIASGIDQIIQDEALREIAELRRKRLEEWMQRHPSSDPDAPIPQTPIDTQSTPTSSPGRNSSSPSDLQTDATTSPLAQTIHPPDSTDEASTPSKTSNQASA
ncbi:MAG: hypothetical protein N2515_01320 [Deltaproteobacteria bacterium]|nr:hypothetical protein [Deltaproteobacteria bacterium]